MFKAIVLTGFGFPLVTRRWIGAYTDQDHDTWGALALPPQKSPTSKWDKAVIYPSKELPLVTMGWLQASDGLRDISQHKTNGMNGRLAFLVCHSSL